MKMKLNKKGFTLAELLIVVAILAILVSISIPLFSAQLEKARKAVDEANVRAAYAEASVDYLEDDTLSKTTYTDGGLNMTASYDSSTNQIQIKVNSGWKATTVTNQVATYTNGVFTYNKDT